MAALGLFAFGLICQAPAGDEVSIDKAASSQGASVAIKARSYGQGEILLLVLQEGGPVRNVTVKFLSRDIVLTPEETGGPSLALAGLDLGLRPGTYFMDFEFLHEDGQTESVRKNIHVESKVFPERRFRILQKYVTPPAEVLERIEREAALVSALYRGTSSRWLAEGDFAPPLPGEIMPSFGQRRTYNNIPRSPHSGVDMDAALGDPVSASNAGTVVLSADLYYSGLTVIIDHGLGVFTVYCHMSQLAVKEGQSVKKRDIVGQVGSTGRSTGPHLHWAVRVLGTRVDPLALLALPLE